MDEATPPEMTDILIFGGVCYLQFGSMVLCPTIDSCSETLHNYAIYHVQRTKEAPCIMRKWRLFTMLLLLCLMMVAGSAMAEEEQVCYGKLSWLGDLPEFSTPAYTQRTTLENYLVDQLQQTAASIDVQKFGIASSDFGKLYWNILNNHPELFYVDGMYFYNTSNGIVTSIRPTYLFTGEELAARIEAFDAAVNRIVAYASTATTQVGKMLLVNDYLCMHYEYDESLTIYSAEEFFREGKGVCQAYTMAYKVVLNELGIANTIANSSSMGHMWNMVQLDGSWYHVDVTWNDPLEDRPLRARHRCFLLSDAAIAAEDHANWSASVTATNTKYDRFFWREIGQPIPVYGDKLYYIDPASPRKATTLCSWQPSAGSRVLHTFNASTSGGYDTGYDPMASNGQRLFYLVNDKVYSVDMNGGNRRLESTVPIAGQYVYSAYSPSGQNSLQLGLAGEGNHLFQQVLSLTASNPDAIALSASVLPMTPGQSTGLTLSFEPAHSVVPCQWTSGNSSVATVTEKGVVKAKAPGVATISVRSSNGLLVQCQVIVHYSNALYLPASLKTVEKEAFVGVGAQDIILPEGTSAIGARAFANCTKLEMITIPASVTAIDATAFAGTANVVILCSEGSAAYTYAVKNRMAYALID